MEKTREDLLDLIATLARALEAQHDTHGGMFSSHDIGPENLQLIEDAKAVLRMHGRHPDTPQSGRRWW